MKITTWNINGIRATMKKDVFGWIEENAADIVCLQEIKAKEEQIEKEPITKAGYEIYINSAERPGYSGVANLFTRSPEAMQRGIGIEKFDAEGRVIKFSYPEFELFNIYFPNGGEENQRVSFKLEFYASLLDYCAKLREQGKEIIITGDFNTAHNEIDLKNPKSNVKNTGFLPEERVWIDKYLDFGFVDAFRMLYPEQETYTWWTYRFGAREKNVGWRLDYYLVTEQIFTHTKDVVIHTEVMGSDHCPVSLLLDY
jgi:exodeoxyribonuclease-3